MLARVTAAVVLAIVLPSCCLTGGWHECDSATYESHCDGNRHAYCLRTGGGSWSGGYEELIEAECAANEICVEPALGSPRCILASSPPCDPSTFVDRCDSNGIVRCTPASSEVPGSYELWDPPCYPGETCTVTGRIASCEVAH